MEGGVADAVDIIRHPYPRRIESQVEHSLGYGVVQRFGTSLGEIEGVQGGIGGDVDAQGETDGWRSGAWRRASVPLLLPLR